MSHTEREAASVVGTAYVQDGVLTVSWVGGDVEQFSPQERQFSEGIPLPWFTFLLWADEDSAPRSLQIRAASFSAAISLLEGRLVAENAAPARITHISHRPMREDEAGRSRYIRTIGGYAPIAA